MALFLFLLKLKSVSYSQTWRNFVSGKVMTYVFQSHERENEVHECKAAQDKVKKYKVKIGFIIFIIKSFYNIQIVLKNI